MCGEQAATLNGSARQCKPHRKFRVSTAAPTVWPQQLAWRCVCHTQAATNLAALLAAVAEPVLVRPHRRLQLRLPGGPPNPADTWVQVGGRGIAALQRHGMPCRGGTCREVPAGAAGMRLAPTTARTWQRRWAPAGRCALRSTRCRCARRAWRAPAAAGGPRGGDVADGAWAEWHVGSHQPFIVEQAYIQKQKPAARRQPPGGGCMASACPGGLI